MAASQVRPMWTVDVSGSLADFQLALQIADAKLYRRGLVRTWLGSHIGDDGVTRQMFIRATGYAVDGVVRWTETVLGVAGPV